LYQQIREDWLNLRNQNNVEFLGNSMGELTGTIFYGHKFSLGLLWVLGYRTRFKDHQKKGKSYDSNF